MDGDGRYDLLVVSVNLSVQTAGFYEVAASLPLGSLPMPQYAWKSTSLGAGPASVDLPFSGTRINNSRMDGPYVIDLTLSGGGEWDRDTYATTAYSHTAFEEVPTIDSAHATIVPIVDGVLSAGEWSDAAVVDLSTIPNNALAASLLVKDDYRMLYIAYDATGDLTEGPKDAAAISFDTGNDVALTIGREDQFVLYGYDGYDQAHYRFYGWSNGWLIEDAPFNTSLPDHAGLAGLRGFGPSDAEPAPHRTYEFAIPFDLLQILPGDTIGFAGGAELMVGCSGVLDWSDAVRPSGWPSTPCPGLLDFGDIVLSSERTPPSLEILSPVQNAIFTTATVTVAWRASDDETGLDRIDVRLDGGEPIVLPPSASEHTFVGLADGTRTISVAAVDRARNVATRDVTIIVDTTPPAVAITSPNPGDYVSGADVEVTWSASDAASGIDRVEIQLDGGAPISLPASATSYAFSGLADGPHTVDLTVFDQAAFSAVATTTFTVDTRAPMVDLRSPPPGVIGSSVIEVTWVASDLGGALDHIEIRLDDAPPTVLSPTASRITLADVSEGSHTIAVTAIDLVGHRASDSVVVTVDTVPPTVEILSPAAGITDSSTIEIRWIASDLGSGVDRVVVQFGADEPIAFPPTAFYTIVGVGDGTYPIIVTAVDLAGNTASDSVVVVVDRTPPDVAITAPASGSYLASPDVALTWTASDATTTIDHYEVSLDGGAPAVFPATTTVHTFLSLPDGSHSFAVTAVDEAGNRQTATAVAVVDTTDPTVYIEYPRPEGVVPSSDVRVTWSASDASSGIDRIEVQLSDDSRTVLPGTAREFTLTGLPDGGAYQFFVEVFDRVGHTKSASVSFFVDTNLPSVQIETPLGGSVLNSREVLLRWVAFDSPAGILRFEIRLDEGALVSLGSEHASYTFVGVADGPHTLTVRAYDLVGHDQVASVSVTIDATPPSLILASPSAGAVLTSSSVDVAWSSADATSGLDRIEVALDGGSPETPSAGETRFVLSGLSDGPHTVTVKAYDRAGNVAIASASFRVDTAIFSPSGPYGYAPIGGLIVGIVAVAAAAFVIVRQRRKGRQPGHRG